MRLRSLSALADRVSAGTRAAEQLELLEVVELI
jgi:hypothetical protein